MTRPSHAPCTPPARLADDGDALLHPMTFFVSRAERRRIIARLRTLDADRTRALVLLVALVDRLDDSGEEVRRA